VQRRVYVEIQPLELWNHSRRMDSHENSKHNVRFRFIDFISKFDRGKKTKKAQSIKRGSRSVTFSTTATIQRALEQKPNSLSNFACAEGVKDESWYHSHDHAQKQIEVGRREKKAKHTESSSQKTANSSTRRQRSLRYIVQRNMRINT